ncbi:substrate-binding domain-containing protein [Aestuariivirga litoralis]|nr:substrate-binding domain-containing protein [Aestuariivirga litoralis]
MKLLYSAVLAAAAFFATQAWADAPESIGPGGAKATPAASVTISAEDAAKIKSGNYTAAFSWHELYDWSNAVSQGAKDEFARLGIKVVAETNASFDASRQKADVETIMALKPSLLISLPADPAVGKATYSALQGSKTKLVFIDNAADGFTYGHDYVSLVTSDRAIIGQKTAEALAKAMNGKGKVGYIFHDADFPVTNQRDQAFLWNLKEKYPDMEVVAKAGMTDPAKAEEIAHAMLTQHPEIQGIYTPWAEPALGVLSALKQLGRNDVRVVTIDLNEPAALDMMKGGSIAGMVADQAYDIGVTAARAGALSLLGKEAPPFLVVGADIVAKDNVAQGWQASLHRDPPKSVLEAAK